MSKSHLMDECTHDWQRTGTHRLSNGCGLLIVYECTKCSAWTEVKKGYKQHRPAPESLLLDEGMAWRDRG